jgi:DNA-binding transcriptional regulator YiaG
MIGAYDEVYLLGAKKRLGAMFDYLIEGCGLLPDEASETFVVSGLAHTFASGNPAVLAGMSGAELAIKTMQISGRDTAAYLAKDYIQTIETPAYWAGWSFAYTQWQSGATFARLFRACPMSYALELYPMYHEMDIMHFATLVDSLLNGEGAPAITGAIGATGAASATNAISSAGAANKNARKVAADNAVSMQTSLAFMRTNAGMSQSQLADASGVGLRSIQLYEQRKRDIDKAQAAILYRLAQALGCQIGDLLEAPLRVA